jgi:hypothetical protein
MIQEMGEMVLKNSTFRNSNTEVIKKTIKGKH